MTNHSDPPEPISVEYNSRTAIITLNKPDKLNSLTKDEYHQLAALLREVDSHAEVFVTVLIGTGRFFSAGADIAQSRTAPPGMSPFRFGLQENVARNLSLIRAFHTHSKILVTALNGPVVGLSAALISWSDFVYSHRDAYLLTPFASLGLVAEGGASYAFVRRMGITRATEALITGRRLSARELVVCGFVNKVFDCAKEEFREAVLRETEERLGPHLNGESMLKIKQLINRGDREEIYANVVDELFQGLDRVVAGIPEKEFAKLRAREKKHKL